MIVSIINLKGGVGKTTTAMALATCAARDGHDAHVLDCDPQASASTWALSAEDADDELPFSVEPSNIATLRSVGRRFGGVDWSWVFIDCPPTGQIVDRAAEVADFVIVPTTTSAADLVKAFETTSTLAASEKPYALLLTRCIANTVALRETLAEFEKRDESWFSTLIPQREALKAFFGNAFGDELFGYDGIWNELLEALAL